MYKNEPSFNGILQLHVFFTVSAQPEPKIAQYYSYLQKQNENKGPSFLVEEPV